MHCGTKALLLLDIDLVHPEAAVPAQPESRFFRFAMRLRFSSVRMSRMRSVGSPYSRQSSLTVHPVSNASNIVRAKAANICRFLAENASPIASARLDIRLRSKHVTGASPAERESFGADGIGRSAFFFFRRIPLTSAFPRHRVAGRTLDKI